MAGLNDYLNPDDAELDPAPTSLDEFEAVRQSGGTPPPMPEGIPEQIKGPLMERYLKLSDQAMSQEKAGISQLQKYIEDYQSKPQELDYTPLAAWADSLTSKPGNSLEAAKLMRPESRSARQEKALALQDKLQQRKGALTQRELTGVTTQMQAQAKSDQLAQARLEAKARFDQQQELAKQRYEQEKIRTEAYKQGITSREKIAQMQLAASKNAKVEGQDRADQRQQAGLDQKDETKLENQLQKYEQKAIDAVPLMENMATVEQILGAPIEQYDPKTESINGKKIDLPGKSIPGVGRVFMPGSQGETLHAAMANIFNTTLKERSGAAVTDQELNRLKNEFAQGKFNTEGKMIEAMQRYKRILKKRMTQHEGAYKPEVRNLYRSQGGMTSEDFFPEPGAGAPPPGPQTKEWNGKKYELQGDTWVEVQ